MASSHGRSHHRTACAAAGIPLSGGIAERLRAAGLVRLRREGFGFEAGAREVLEAGLVPERRAELHRACADAVAS